jgi:hypothetical protein
MSATNCGFCRRTLKGFFEITRYDNAGEKRGDVRVCSALCLIRWSYEYAARRSLTGIVAAKGAFDRLVESLKGARGPD